MSGNPAFRMRLHGWLQHREARVAEAGNRILGGMVLGPPPSYAPPAQVPELYLQGLVTSRRPRTPAWDGS
jgi:hypothetical protein